MAPHGPDPGALLQGRFQVEQRLGEGGMGTVYLVRDLHLAGRLCALKELTSRSESDAEHQDGLRRFALEAEILATLSHPGIPQIYDRFSENGRYYMVMEYVAGLNLAQVLARQLDRKGAPLPEAEVVQWAMQLCDILAYLHGHNPAVIHRDLKPGNVVRIEGDQVKLLDFGIARASTVRGGTMVGTPGYAPPEQYQGDATPQSDLYSLGATLYHLLTGRDPQLLAIGFPPVFPPDLNISAAIRELLSNLLSPDPRSRPQSAETARKGLTDAHPHILPHQPGTTSQGSAELLHAAPDFHGVCPICLAPLSTEDASCTQCGLKVLGPFRKGQVSGRATDLLLRVPPEFWAKCHPELVTLTVANSPTSGMGYLLTRLSGSIRDYTFVVRQNRREQMGPSSLVGAPVEPYRSEIANDLLVLTAIPPHDYQESAEVARLWRSWSTS